MKTMRTKWAWIGLLAFLFACSKNNEPGIQPYTAKQLADLSLATVQNLETPYTGVFKAGGGRVGHEPTALADISQKLVAIFKDATVLGAESEMERGLEVWSVKVKMPGGGILKFKFVKELGKIIKIKGKPGPFDYEVDPGGSFIKFSAAKALALGAVKGEIMSWKLQVEEENQWKYEFHIVHDSKRYEVDIKGFNEEVLSIKEKKHGDDEDNDGDDHGDEEDDNNESVDAPAAVLQLVASLFQGTITHSERQDENGHTYWKVYVKNEAGAVVNFLVSGDPIALIKMGGAVGPFVYDIHPGNDLIALSAALEKVFHEVKGDLTKWKLEREEEQGENVWIYEFEVRGQEVNYEIKINARTGAIMEFKKHG